jgi:putative transposase
MISYQSDISDKNWQMVEPHIPKPKTKRGRKREHAIRIIFNAIAIFYILRSGCQWRMMPHDFPPWSTVYHYFRLWRLKGIWEQINTALRSELRIADGRQPEPRAAIIDSQSVKTTETRGRYRRLSKDYEGLPESSESMIYAGMIHLMLKRLARRGSYNS